MNVDEYIKLGLHHSIHTSERKAFRACRRRWNWSYRQGYHPKVTPKPLEFGIAIHRAFEVWYEPQTWFDDRDTQSALAIAAFKQVCDTQLKTFRELNGEPEEEVLADYRERVDLGVEMVRYYTKKVSPIIDKGLTPLAVEIPFEVPMGFNCKCDSCWITWRSHLIRQMVDVQCDKPENFIGLPVTFGGRIDAIIKDQRDRIYCYDWKTTARILDDEDEAAFLQLDDQVGGYPVALYKLGKRVDGFIYHEQRKAVPVSPKQLKRPYQGKLYSTDKTAAVEYDSFFSTILRNDLGAYNVGLYDEYLKFLMGPMAPKFYQRHTIYKTEEQMDNFWNDLIAEAHDMLEQPRIYPQASRFSCNSCLYRQPCEGKNRNEDYKYTLDSNFIKELR